MSETRTWLKFFEDAGIPRSSCATYAMAFIENRITNELLLDLDKEYLRDMKIQKLGDIICILKHAKKISERNSSTTTTTTTPTTSTTLITPSSSEENKFDGRLGRKENIKNKTKESVPSIEYSLESSEILSSPSSTTSSSSSSSLSNSSLSNSSHFSNSISHHVSKEPPKSVFERLDAPVNNQSLQKITPSILRKKPKFSNEHNSVVHSTSKIISLIGPKPTNSLSPLETKRVSFHNDSKNSLLEKNDKDLSSVKNRLGNIKPVPAIGLPDSNKAKKYVMIQTLKDGSKIKRILSPEDPILKKVPILKKTIGKEDKTKKYENFIVTKPNLCSIRNEEDTLKRKNSSSHSSGISTPEAKSRRKRISPPSEPKESFNKSKSKMEKIFLDKY